MKEFKKLEPWQQLVVIVLAAIVIFWIFNWAKGFFTGIIEQAGDRGEITALQAQGQNASYTTSQYMQMADDLEYAMSGLGTDEELIFSTFSQLRNDIDAIKLNSTFGVRDGENLKSWLRGDLSGSDMMQLNSLLASNNITQRF